ncbi:MAG: SDR family oxidoreductase [Betaproteobacteria bacterium]|nr:SDR family oxidoreductase [Pseudomonadota bacterium]NCZ58600.1 SDR family oxidoreductase [Betaproteobacteria bacterium]NDA73416.1 SDR family oxidoreductase [Betaproteobacteria bacterium]NDH35051.1 SDR family oxidoreductase [Betaproteobacteria bacterium]
MTPPSKVAIVTGAGSGVGRAVSLAFLGAGYRVVLAGRREDALHETLEMAMGAEDRALVQITDVCDPASVDAMLAACVARFGRLDLLFNNAGIGAPAVPIEELPLESWRRVVDTNLTGSFLCIQAAVRQMKSQQPQGGRIINNGSIAAYAPRPNSIAYTATKHAITGLTRSTALDGRKFSIACGQIDIGNAETPMAARMAKGVPQANGEIAAEPLMDVAHVGESVLHMAELPLQSNVLFMTVMASNMPFVGRG